MTASCLRISSLPNPRDYLPTREENKKNIYGLFASVFTSGIIYGPMQGLAAPFYFTMGCVCYKLIDYLSDALLKGSVTEDKLTLIKGALKAASTFFAVLYSFKVMHYSLDSLLVSFVIYIALSTHLTVFDPLALVGL